MAGTRSIHHLTPAARSHEEVIFGFDHWIRNRAAVGGGGLRLAYLGGGGNAGAVPAGPSLTQPPSPSRPSAHGTTVPRRLHHDGE